MAIWQYYLDATPIKVISLNSGTENMWKNANINIDKLTSDINEFISLKNKCQKPGLASWKGDTNNMEDNDILISYNLYTKQILGLQIRTDIRKKHNIHCFLNKMLDICNKNNLYVLNVDDILLEPTAEIVLKDLKTSTAFRTFCNEN